MAELKVIHDAFTRAGLVEQTPHTRWTVSVSAQPVSGGSGAEHETRKVSLCAACGSTDTRCVHREGVFGKEQWENLELLCSDCGAYTQWRWDAW